MAISIVNFIYTIKIYAFEINFNAFCVFWCSEGPGAPLDTVLDQFLLQNNGFP